MNRSTSVRAKVLNVDHKALDDAILMASEGKVTNKNAWDIPIIEGMTDTVEAYMETEGDAYAQFTKAASLVESGAKVWAHRVENTLQMTTQVQQRLMRCDTKNDADDMQRSQDTKEESESSTQRGASARTQEEISRKRKPADFRTLASSNEEICVKHTDEKHYEVDPLFRATSRKFDQGHASGLLLNHARLGPHCNLMMGCENVVEENTLPETTSQPELSTQLADSTEERDPPLSPPSHTIPSLSLDTEVFRTSSSSAHPSGASRLASSHPASSDSSQDGALGDGSPFEGMDPPGRLESHSRDLSPAHPPPSGFSSQLTAHGEEMREAVELLDGTLELNRVDSWLTSHGRRSGSYMDPAGGGAASGLGEEDPDFIPMQSGADSVLLRSGSALDEIRKAAAVTVGEDTRPGAFAGANETEETRVPGKGVKRKKSVRFAVDETSETWSTTGEWNVKVRCHNHPHASLTILGKEWLTQGKDGMPPEDFKDDDKASCLALARGLCHSLEDSSMPQFLQCTFDARSFLQPFCCTEPHWNWMEQHAQKYEGGRGMDLRRHRELSVSGDSIEDNVGLPIPDDMEDLSSDIPENEDYPDAEDTAFGVTDLETGMADISPEQRRRTILEDPSTISSVLLDHAITKPSLVDVGKLRRVMWDHVKLVNQNFELESKSDMPMEATSHNTKDMAVENGVPLSSIMLSMIERGEVSKISKDGSLSPAFFYFSLLFLANEHQLELSQTSDLSDVYVRISQ